MTIVTKALSCLGLMPIAEHENPHSDLKRRVGEAETAPIDWEAKFKKAITDLAAAQDAIKELRGHFAYAEADAASLRPDAQKWRDRAAREAKRGQNRKAARQ